MFIRRKVELNFAGLFDLFIHKNPFKIMADNWTRRWRRRKNSDFLNNWKHSVAAISFIFIPKNWFWKFYQTLSHQIHVLQFSSKDVNLTPKVIFNTDKSFGNICWKMLETQFCFYSIYYSNSQDIFCVCLFACTFPLSINIFCNK